jgi:hypothetical protein
VRLGVLSLFLAAVAGCGMSRAGALMSADEALGANDCATVLENAQFAESTGNPSDDELAHSAFLRAKCAERAGELSDARGLYDYIADMWPDTQWGYRALSILRDLDSQPGSEAELP